MPVFLELSLACVSSVCALRGRLVPDGMSVYAPRGTLVRLSLCARRGRLARFSVLFRADYVWALQEIAGQGVPGSQI